MASSEFDIYGYCPVCGANCNTRERRLNGDDTCINGHKYPSATSLHGSLYQERMKLLEQRIAAVENKLGL